MSTPIDKNDPLPVHGSFRGRLYAGAPHDGVQEVRHLDVKSAVRYRPQGRLRDCQHLRPGRDACSAEADLDSSKTGSCGAHLPLELGAIGPDGMEDDSHFARESDLGLFGADTFGQFVAPALERRTAPDNGQEEFAASNK
ncbi:hypothetical protein [Bradyrhizobium sp. 154]|uniref:hypothetical protein n=1 Tax=unclassified Bradyrhizobium TaxID=2631580 RepID=UPI0032084D07